MGGSGHGDSPRAIEQHDMGFALVAACVVIAIAIIALPPAIGRGVDRGHASTSGQESQDVAVAHASVTTLAGVAEGVVRKSMAAHALQAAPIAGTGSIGRHDNAALRATTSSRGVRYVAPPGLSATKESRALDMAIATFEAHGYQLGIALVDVQTGCSISYSADVPRYPASSIKAAFCTFVYEQNGPVSEAVVADCLIESSNEAYHALIRTYGQQAFAAWLEPMAPDAAANAALHFYPWISPREFLAVWQEVYRFGTSDEPGGAELADLLARTNYSAWGDLLRDDYEVWAKPGWYPTTEERATNDCAVVFSDCGPYVAVVMSDAPEDFEALMPVLDALDVVHGRMCGGSTESHLRRSEDAQA